LPVSGVNLLAAIVILARQNCPPGRFFAEIFGPNPGEILDQDLKRLKYLFENEEFKNEESELLRTATT
jgi:hypothetical protein